MNDFSLSGRLDIFSYQSSLSELYTHCLVLLLPRLLPFFHKCALLNCLKSTSCYYTLFSKKTNFSKEDKSPILIRAFAVGRLFWLIQAATSSSTSIILFSGLISFEHKDGTILDSFDIWDTAIQQPCFWPSQFSCRDSKNSSKIISFIFSIRKCIFKWRTS